MAAVGSGGPPRDFGEELEALSQAKVTVDNCMTLAEKVLIIRNAILGPDAHPAGSGGAAAGGGRSPVDRASKDGLSERVLEVYKAIVSHIPKDGSAAHAKAALETVGNQLEGREAKRDENTIQRTRYGLDEAAKKGCFELVRLLLNDQEARGWDKGSALVGAAREGHLSVVGLLDESEGIPDRFRQEAIEHLAAQGDLRLVRQLLSKVRLSHQSRGRAVVNAVRKGNDEIARLLLKRSSIPIDAMGEAMRHAAKEANLGLVRFLVQRTSRREESCFRSAVREAVLEGNVEVVNYFFDNGLISLRYQAPLVELAAQQGHIELFGQLLDRVGLSVYEKGRVLERATRDGRLEIASMILDRGGIDTRDRSEAARLAAVNQSLEFVQLLFESGATLPDTRSRAALAASRRLPPGGVVDEIIAYLLPEGAIIRDRDHQGAVLCSARNGHTASLELLLHRQAIPRDLRDSAITQARNGTIRDILRSAPLMPEGGLGAAEAVGEAAHVVTLASVEENPVAFVEHVCSHGVPPRIVLSDTPHVVDLGGVLKQVITLCCQSLLARGWLHLSATGLPVVIHSLPREEGVMRTMGLFFSRIVERNRERSDKFLTGSLFHPQFLGLVRVGVVEETEDAKVRAGAEWIRDNAPADFDDEVELVLEPTDEKYQALADIAMAEIVEEIPDPLPAGRVREEFVTKKSLMDGARNRVLQAVHLAAKFYEGTEGCLREKLDAGFANPPALEALLKSVQGERASKEAILEALDVIGDSPHLRQQVQWLREKIEAATPEWHEKFLVAITGKATLGLGDKIALKTSWREGATFELHTCFSSMDLPTEPLSKEDFLAALEVAIDSEDYNIS